MRGQACTPQQNGLIRHSGRWHDTGL